jgi:hypothetical protein
MDINKLDPVYTRDHQYLGAAHRLYHRTHGIRPGWKHFATYMLVQSFAQGDDFYVPTEFIAGRDPQAGHIMLTVTEKDVETKTWTRLPEFVLHGEANIEELVDRVLDEL